MKTLWLRWRYGFEMAQAYVASWCDERDCQKTHKGIADSVADELSLIEFKQTRSLF